MKTRITTICIIALMSLVDRLIAQEENTLIFTYDGAGNMIERKVQVLLSGRMGKPGPKDTMEIPPALNFKIYPNPTNQYLNLEGDLPEDIQESKIFLLNINGQILKEDLYLEGQPKMIDVTGMKSGIYFLEMIYSKNKRSTYKIIITN